MILENIALRMGDRRRPALCIGQVWSSGCTQDVVGWSFAPKLRTGCNFAQVRLGGGGDMSLACAEDILQPLPGHEL